MEHIVLDYNYGLTAPAPVPIDLQLSLDSLKRLLHFETMVEYEVGIGVIPDGIPMRLVQNFGRYSLEDFERLKCFIVLQPSK